MTLLALMLAVAAGPPPSSAPNMVGKAGDIRHACDRDCRRRMRWERTVDPYRATLRRIASCESGNNPRAVSSTGTYRGLLQFDYGTWASVGGSGDPAAASRLEQLYRGALLYKQRGSAPWPVCQHA
jgi:soluble lytic murein transglycosylase-like protein